MDNCIFCKIINGQLPSEKVYEDEEILAFKDINPVAPVHLLVIPKTHIDGMDKAENMHQELLGKILLTAKKLAAEYRLDNGYRLITNIGDEGGQSVRHLHFHIIGGRKLELKMG